MKYTETDITAEAAVLVGLATDACPREECEVSLEELRRLLETAGGETAAVMIQQRHTPDVNTYLGSGKLAELKQLCHDFEAGMAIFDTELTPSQIRNIEDELDGITVIDRSMLILDIFALHAVTAEGKLQVELAQLKYTAPRLVGKGKAMSRLGGGIGTRGPGESKLESDKRYIKRRILALEDELENLEIQRRTARASRDRSGIPKAAIVGYTNAGKSTLLNRLTDAGILAEDKLFATLDPTTRKFTLPGGESILLTDTVGFIRNLPHHLIKAFSSTLEEAVYADILIIIVDASDPEYPAQLEVTENLLAELGAGGKPTLLVFNKCDKDPTGLNIPAPETVDCATRKTVCISALTGQGTDDLCAALSELVRAGKSSVRFEIPNKDAGMLNLLYKNATVESVEYGPESISVKATVDAKIRGMLAAYEKSEANE